MVNEIAIAYVEVGQVEKALAVVRSIANESEKATRGVLTPCISKTKRQPSQTENLRRNSWRRIKKDWS